MEKYYISNKTLITDKLLYDFFATRQIPGFDYHDFWLHKSSPIHIALAFSGGGYRSMLTGAGVFEAYDDRLPIKSELGGLLQAITYIGGISGGSWLVMSNVVNDFKPIHKVIQDNDWSLQTQLLEGVPNFDPKTIKVPSFNIQKKSFLSTLKRIFRIKDVNEQVNDNIVTLFENLFKNDRRADTMTTYERATQILEFYNGLHFDVLTKKAAGFPVSFTDYWGKALSKKLFPTMQNCSGLTFTSSTKVSSFQNFEQPFPIICSIERDPNFKEDHNSSHLFEITPYEFGSWDKFLKTFLPIKYLGTPMIEGYSMNFDKSTNKSICIYGFDNVGFITGTSSSLFNTVFARVFDFIFEFTKETTMALRTILEAFGIYKNEKDEDANNKSFLKNKSHPEYAIYSPNPFYGLNSSIEGRSIFANNTLYFADGGDDGQNVPFHPFLRKERPVLVIFAFDMSSDKMNYPNGSALLRTSKRYLNISSDENFYYRNSTRSLFPNVPTPEEIIEHKLDDKPIFLGCDLSDFNEVRSYKMDNHSYSNYLPPLIIYQGNYNHSFPSNRSTFQLSYNSEEVNGMIVNGINLATYLNSTMYPMCVRCAILKREFDRIELGWNLHYTSDSFKIPKICSKCFAKFCWRLQITRNGFV